MSRISEHHQKLTDGVGKCSVPMWSGGLDAGFCDKPAFGKPVLDDFGNSRYGDFDWNTKRWINGYVPALACPAHGGPSGRAE